MTKDIAYSYCVSCGIEFCAHHKSEGKYCSNACQQMVQYAAYIVRWKAGFEKGWIGKTAAIASPIRRYLLEKFNYACSICGWDQRHPVDGRPLVEVEHVDGDAKHCDEDNLTILCPNHHAMTPTFRARNKKSARCRK